VCDYVFIVRDKEKHEQAHVVCGIMQPHHLWRD
jgi:hypothetical protein